MVKRKWLWGQEGKITLCTKPEPRAPWTKVFLCVHGISEMRRNALLGSVGVVLAPWCAPTELYLEDLAINQIQGWFVWISLAFFFFLFKQSWSISLAGLELNQECRLTSNLWFFFLLRTFKCSDDKLNPQACKPVLFLFSFFAFCCLFLKWNNEILMACSLNERRTKKPQQWLWGNPGRGREKVVEASKRLETDHAHTDGKKDIVLAPKSPFN